MGRHIQGAERSRLGTAAQVTLWALGALLTLITIFAVFESSEAADSSPQATLLSPGLIDKAEEVSDDSDAIDLLGCAIGGPPSAIAMLVPGPGVECQQEGGRQGSGQRIGLLLAPKTSPPHSLA